MNKRLIFILACAVIAAIATPFIQPFVCHNSELVLIIVTVFAVFAGFLVGVITIIGDPTLLPRGSWRLAELNRENVERRLVTHVSLFILYLLTIGLLFTGVVMQSALADANIVKIWIERLYVFFGVFSFLLTFGLPFVLMKVQRARVDAEIEQRREREGMSAAGPEGK